jgi:preprotein translocase subunit SecY
MEGAGLFLKAHDLKKKILFTLFALFICRLGSYVTIPGINSVALNTMAEANAKGILGMFNVLSGGSLSRMSVFALSIVPYITSSIVMSLITVTIKPLEEMKKEGEAGRRKINRYTRYLTVLLCGFQAYGVATGLEHAGSGDAKIVTMSSFALFRLVTVVSLVVGTMFLMWLAEQISMRGIGNGTSLIIFVGIVSGLPTTFVSLFELAKTGVMSPITLMVVLAAVFGLIYLIVFVERAQRQITIQYPRRQVGNKIFDGQNTHLPLKINTAGVIPPIFANSILLFPLTITSFISVGGEDSIWNSILIHLGRGKPLYLLLYVSFIVFFSFFYTSIVFNVKETSDMLKKNGGFIPGIRPGDHTATYLDKVLSKLTAIGAAYMSFVCVLPEYVSYKYAVPFYLGGTSFLIVVSVVMDTFVQIQTMLFTHQYESLMRKARFRKF